MGRFLAVLALCLWGLGLAQMRLESPAFGWGSPIPVRYTCDGANLSPPLIFAGVPLNAASLALVLFDPDAPGGIFYHWIVYDLVPGRRGLPEGVPGRPRLPGLLQGINDFGRPGYGGPCPPRGDRPHRYFFRLYAIRSPSLGLPPGAPARRVLTRLERMHVLAGAEWMGVYAR